MSFYKNVFETDFVVVVVVARLAKMRHLDFICCVYSRMRLRRARGLRLQGKKKKILTADLADNTAAVFQLLSATLVQGNMSRLARCELNSAA